jgi:hypothetical protein
VILFASNTLNAQEQEDDTTDKSEHKITSIKDFMKQSDWHFHSRTFFMSTINDGALKDDYTLAQGAGIGLLTTPVKGFQIGISGYFIFNLASSDLEKPDPSTGQSNRYELGQYDLTNHLNKKDLDRLEDLYVNYKYRKHSITLGRMELQTPFLNMQDGRMRPTIEEGVWLKFNLHKKLIVNGGYIWSVSPRSTIEWFKLGESVGIYGQGINTDGSKSNYKNNIESKGFSMLNLAIKPNDNIEINIWDGYFDNVMNTVLLELKNENVVFAKKLKLYENIMFIHQDAIANGGNINQSITYINRGAQANAISGRLGLKNKTMDWNINYTHITNDGRYLMPREWGRDPFYTFMARERNEGTGGLNAYTTSFTLSSLKKHFKSGIGYGYYVFPDVTNFELNKYGMPSYHQMNISSSFNFDKFWKGLEIRMLIAGKLNSNDTTLDPKFIYNKVNMLNFNLIIDLKI